MKLILSSDTSIYSVCIDGNGPEISQLPFQAETLNYPRPIGTSFWGPQIVGSCRGLLCLKFPKCAFLWNPATKTHHEMPEPEDDSDSEERKNWRSYVVQGLGYDESNDDYKVIRVYQYLGPPNGAKKFDSKVLVYSLKSNSWKRVADFPYFVHFRMMNDVFVNGALHFKVSNKRQSDEGDDTVDSECMIAAFDVSNFTYKVVTHISASKRKYEVELGVLDKCLSLICNYDLGVSLCLVLKEYGVRLPWTELFRTRRGDGRKSKLRPIGYLGDEKYVILEEGGQIFCVGLERTFFENIVIDGIDDEDFEVCVCMESEVVLRSVDGNDSDKIQQQVNEENLEQVNEENTEQVSEENLESEVVLDSVDKIQPQVNEEVSEENLESDVVLDSADGNNCDNMQHQVNGELNEEDLEVVSAKRDVGAT